MLRGVSEDAAVGVGRVVFHVLKYEDDFFLLGLDLVDCLIVDIKKQALAIEMFFHF
jgi:hypothetical protein